MRLRRKLRAACLVPKIFPSDRGSHRLSDSDKKLLQFYTWLFYTILMRIETFEREQIVWTHDCRLRQARFWTLISNMRSRRWVIVQHQGFEWIAAYFYKALEGLFLSHRKDEWLSSQTALPFRQAFSCELDNVQSKGQRTTVDSLRQRRSVFKTLMTKIETDKYLTMNSALT